MFTKAQWIWTKDTTLTPGHFVFFRQNLKIKNHIKTSDLLISADSKYRLWINGKYAGTGPARGRPGAPYVDSYDVHSFLHSGDNIIAVLVEYYSGGSIIFSPVHGGLILELSIDQKTVLYSDHNWKCSSVKGYSIIPAGYQHLEIFNANYIPENWQNLTFNASSWDNSIYVKAGVLAAPSELFLRSIPPLTNNIYTAKTVISIGLTSNEKDTSIEDLAISIRDMKRSQTFNLESTPPINTIADFPPAGIVVKALKSFYIEVDMGEEVLGTPCFSINTEVATVIDIGYSEVLENNQVNPFRQNIFFAEQFITQAGKTEYTVFQPRGFRYLVMRFNTDKPVKINSIRVIEEIYPANRKGHFNSSDEALNKIYKMCQRTMNLCMEDAFTDCPWRERQQWLGDLMVESKTALYALGAVDILRKAILEFSEIKTGEGWMYAVAPGGTGLNLPTFGMYFPALAWSYYCFTGEETILERVYATIKEMSTFLESICKDDLILTRNLLTQDNIWHFVDWTKTDANNSDGALQGLYLYFLQFASKIAQVLKQTQDKLDFDEKFEKTKQAIENSFWSEEKSAFLKYRSDGSTLPADTPRLVIGQHENFLFPLLNIGSRRQQKLAHQAIQGHSGKYLPDLGGIQSYFFKDQCGSISDKEIIMLGSPFFSYFALASFYAAGKYIEALEYIKICWGFMLDNGPGTCWEMWGGETSLCHGFSTSPVYFIYSEILGILPQVAGFGEIKIAPRTLILERAEGTIPLVQGYLTFRWKKYRTEVKIDLDIPPQCKAFFHIPDGYKFKDKNKKCKIFKEGQHHFIIHEK